MFIRLTSKSLVYRKWSVLLTVFAMSISIFVMLGVEHIRQQAKTSFSSSVSGVDLIVGSRTGSLNLLLYSVFRMGAPTSNISWQSYEKLAKDNKVKWTIPISLGDSHKGYRVVGTTPAYFNYFSYGKQQSLNFQQGDAFSKVYEVVLGSAVAGKLGYQVGDAITLSHGIGSTSFTNHTDSPFHVVGILAATGTPVDQTVHVSLHGLEAVHSNQYKTNLRGKVGNDYLLIENQHLSPSSITAVLVGLKSRMMVFQLQRTLNTTNSEPLSAILPGVALSELWRTMSTVEQTMRLISGLVVVSALLGLSAMLLASIRERQNELKLLRMIGASPLFVYWFIEFEALVITLLSTVVGSGVLFLILTIAQEPLLQHFGLAVTTNIMSTGSLSTLGVIFMFAFIAGIPPAFKAYLGARKS